MGSTDRRRLPGRRGACGPSWTVSGPGDQMTPLTASKVAHWQTLTRTRMRGSRSPTSVQAGDCGSLATARTGRSFMRFHSGRIRHRRPRWQRQGREISIDFGSSFRVVDLVERIRPGLASALGQPREVWRSKKHASRHRRHHRRHHHRRHRHTTATATTASSHKRGAGASTGIRLASSEACRTGRWCVRHASIAGATRRAQINSAIASSRPVRWSS